MKLFTHLTLFALLGHFTAATVTYDNMVWVKKEGAPYDVCTNDEFGLFDPILGAALDGAYTTVLAYAPDFSIEWESYNSLTRENVLGKGGDRNLVSVTNDDRELCDCPCICAGSQWLCDALCGGGRRRLRAARKLSDETVAALEGKLTENCANTLSDLNIAGMSEECLSALRGATCQAQVTVN